MSDNPFVWDLYSDQPYPIKDKAYKKRMRKKHIFDYIPLILLNIIYFPLGVILTNFFKGKNKILKNFFGMSVYLEKGEDQINLIKELNCKNILIRVPLSDIENLDLYIEFAKRFEECNILVNILQDRRHIDDKELLENSLKSIFLGFKGISNEFQVANAINRTKWGFFSVKEYLEFYKVAFELRNRFFKDYILMGPSVIDFEYHFTIRALFSNYKIFFDKVSALLYVDRRGAPENTQMVSFDTRKKIDFLYSLSTLSKISSNKLVITESNWPISNTAPYAPTSEFECISEDDYARFMLRYYLLAISTQKVEKIYWHQLIAAGYGLLDHREGIRKRTAFYVFKVMIDFLDESEVLSFKKNNEVYKISCKKENKEFDIIWLNSKNEIGLKEQENFIVYDMFGKKIEENIKISENPIYVYSK